MAILALLVSKPQEETMYHLSQNQQRVVQLALYIMVLALVVENFQDVRDIEEDTKAGTITLPVNFGVQQMKILFMALNFTTFIAQQLILPDNNMGGFHFLLIAIHGLTVTLITQICRNLPIKWFFYMEALYMVPLAMYFMCIGLTSTPSS